MNNTCTQCAQQFEVTEGDLKFYDKISPVFHGKKYAIPAPRLCPPCRQQRRLSFRNERKLYNRICNATGAPIISMYAPDKNLVVYSQEYWTSDQWDPMSYGRDYDFSKPFFTQFQELFAAVPQIALWSYVNENAAFVNYSSWNKDSYLLFESDNNDRCIHADHSYQNFECLDVSVARKNEAGYELLDCQNCYNCRYSQNCENCRDSWFLKNCIGCNNCFGSINLTNKEYYFFNQACTKEVYEQKIASLALHTHAGIERVKKVFAEHVMKYPHRAYIGTQNEHISGDYIYHSIDSDDCFDVQNIQNSKFVYNCENAKDVYDCDNYGGVEGMELVLEGHSVGSGVQSILWSHLIYENAMNVFYSFCCKGLKNGFGCVNLKSAKEYCILNKQYTKEEYEALVPKIIEHMQSTGEWGEYFSQRISPFGYNETTAYEQFPLTKEVALQRGFQWSEYVSPTAQVTRTIQASELPQTSDVVNEEICQWAILCESTGKPFRITKPELGFYKKYLLPLPRRHPDQRYKERISLRNPRVLYSRPCAKCQKEMRTTYAPDRPEIVYCETCYQQSLG